MPAVFQPSLRDSPPSVLPPRTFVLGYFHSSLATFIRPFGTFAGGDYGPGAKKSAMGGQVKIAQHEVLGGRGKRTQSRRDD
jgi:hypothetical protein